MVQSGNATGPQVPRRWPGRPMAVVFNVTAPPAVNISPHDSEPQELVLGAQEIFSIVNPYGKYLLVPPGVGIARAGEHLGRRDRPHGPGRSGLQGAAAAPTPPWTPSDAASTMPCWVLGAALVAWQSGDCKPRPSLRGEEGGG